MDNEEIGKQIVQLKAESTKFLADVLINNDSYKDFPQSIGEIKSDKTQDAEHWTPRECLINMLRQIDNGLDVKILVICLQYDEDDKVKFSQSTYSGIKSVGLLEYCKASII